jgi:hypothetical protein
MSVSLKKSFLYIPGFILLISIFASVEVENNNIPLPIKMEYAMPIANGQGGDEIDTDNVENSEEVPQHLQQDSTDNNNNEDNNGIGNADPTQSDQSNGCPEINASPDTPIFVGQDGCQHPCPDNGNRNQGNTPQGCPIEAIQSSSTSSFASDSEPPPQPLHNAPTSQSQSTFVNPRINSDTATSTDRTNTDIPTTQKSFSSAGQYKPGSALTELNVPGQSNDPISGPYYLHQKRTLKLRLNLEIYQLRFLIRLI